ncbi:hypothetical protein P872_18490 [Rhodonellum psychrophilum GCM71 = DSM 17998]|uniref:Phage protein, HK97 gp10 family n=2 Tax=Rhodonellum TaxID=336827 RepID=U5BPA5_9BACT|nr:MULTISPECIES: HK97-gp10 family putative phage morphogenesis protein [Rhodonellum]ERM82385.1 hypothetical protein P872_18490 [Rhodonellum psychrophilum GCM71 = DSM 17998]SDZ35641.1 phage protein, HK97 gp10 family [Rhodonellum ikkaensis]
MSSNKINISIDTKKLLEALRKMPDKIQDKVIRAGVRKGANSIKREAKTNAPVDSGLMKNSIKVKPARRSSKAGKFVMIVNVASNAHHLVELGTEDREGKNGKKLKFQSANGNTIYIKKVAGIKANPFLGKAYESKKDEIISEFNKELQKQINKFSN